MNELMQSETKKYPYSLFEVLGIELEYMIVDAATLDVLPLCDKLLAEIAGHITNEVHPDGDSGIAAWSNELALHVLEFKTINPVPELTGTAAIFQSQVKRALSMLEPYGAILMPAAMHPWMNPDREFSIWPHGSRDIYNMFDAIFGCKGHGWSNLQSVHINLPFSDSGEFSILHNAIRLLLPVMSGLTASSPFAEGGYTGYHDYRMEVYRTNSRIIPSITGLVIPEPTRGIDEYRTTVLERIYHDLEVYDPGKIISHEWVNARGCIPRFDRGSIEIRTLDIQECPAADIACVELFTSAIKALAEEKFFPLEEMFRINTESLYGIFLDCIKNGSSSIINDYGYLALFGMDKNCSIIEFWKRIAERVIPADSPAHKYLSHIFSHGDLASRILKRTGNNPDKQMLEDVYREISQCLASGVQLT